MRARAIRVACWAPRLRSSNAFLPKRCFDFKPEPQILDVWKRSLRGVAAMPSLLLAGTNGEKPGEEEGSKASQLLHIFPSGGVAGACQRLFPHPILPLEKAE